jgi:hypothetical protein
MKRRTPTDTEVTLEKIHLNVSTSPLAKGYEIQVSADTPKSETIWLPLPLTEPVGFHVGRKATHPKVMQVAFQIRLRNSPAGNVNHHPGTPPTSVYWQGALDKDTNFVFVLPGS